MMGTAKKEMQRGSLARGLDVLRAICAGPEEGLRLPAISKETGLHRASAHRIVGALLEEGMITRVGAHSFGPGPGAWEIGYAARRAFDIGRLAQSSLQALASDPGDVSFLQVRSGNMAVCLEREDGDYQIRPLSLQVGDRRPLGVGAGSVVLLAALTDEEIEKIITADIAGRMGYAVFDRDTIWRLVRRVRDTGFGHIEGEVVKHSFAQGIALRNANGEVIAALSCAGVEGRFDSARQERARERLREEALLIEQRMPGRLQAVSDEWAGRPGTT